MITVDEFKEYFAVFNAREYDVFLRFYADDIVYVMDQRPFENGLIV